jgi:hypothetical protein
MQEEDWKKEWKDMPEFISENKKPLQQIKISFRNYDDVLEFARILDLKVTPKTDALWYPPKPKETGLVYKSEDWNNEE